MRPAALPSFLVALSLAASAVPARAQLSALETHDLRLIYLKPTSYLAPYAARCFENSMGFQRRLFSYTPSEKVTVLLDDLSDRGNASAGVIPRDSLEVQIAPLNFSYERMPANENLNWTMNHELVHIAAHDQTAGSDRFFRGLFAGKVVPIAEQPETILYYYLTTPRSAAPRWYHEGIAVFVETWMAGGRGRAQGAYDEMILRAMVRDGSRFYDPLGLVSEGTRVDYLDEANSYLYGTRFMSYLAYRYSPESLIRWVSRTSGSKAYYSSQFKQVYGVSLEQAWRDWVQWEHGFQQANLDAIRQYPTTPFEDLSPRALGAVSRAFLDHDDRKIYAAFNYPGVVAHVGAISLEDGSVEKLRDVKDPEHYDVTTLAYDPDTQTLFYTSDNHAYRDLLALDPKTKRARTLIKDARVGNLVFNRVDRSLWGVRTFNGICTLVRIAFPYKEWKRVRSWPYGEVLYDLDISPDGQLLSASLGEISGKQTLRVMKIESLLSGDATPVTSFDFGTAIPESFVFSADGKYLYGSSYYTGVSNIFRYELATGSLEAVSNTETGFFRPIPLEQDSLIAFRYTGNGFIPARIEAKPLEDVSAITFLGQQVVEEHPVLKDWMVGSPADIELEPMLTHEGRYASIKSVRPESLYPIVQGYKDFAAYGLRFNFSDPMELNHANLTASYSPGNSLPENERLHLQAEYRRYDWKASFKLNGADFYDLVGPTKTSLKGYAVGLGWRRTLVYDLPRRLDVSLDGTYYGGLERLPDFQNVPTSFEKLLATRLRLTFSNLRHSLGYVDEEKGEKWEILVAGDRVKGNSFPKFLSNLDLGFALPIRHSSIWLRSSAGYSHGDPEEPFANFYFGGFGNNWLDHREEQRYREWYAFPGVELNEIGGRNFVKSMVEWALPPVRFRRAGTPGFYMKWARPAVFASFLGTDLDDASRRRTLANVGAQLDLRFTILSALDMTLSAGYGMAVEDGFKPRHEGMISLKVLQ